MYLWKQEKGLMYRYYLSFRLAGRGGCLNRTVTCWWDDTFLATGEYETNVPMSAWFTNECITTARLCGMWRVFIRKRQQNTSFYQWNVSEVFFKRILYSVTQKTRVKFTVAVKRSSWVQHSQLRICRLTGTNGSEKLLRSKLESLYNRTPGHQAREAPIYVRLSFISVNFPNVCTMSNRLGLILAARVNYLRKSFITSTPTPQHFRSRWFRSRPGRGKNEVETYVKCFYFALVSTFFRVYISMHGRPFVNFGRFYLQATQTGFLGLA